MFHLEKIYIVTDLSFLKHDFQECFNYIFGFLGLTVNQTQIQMYPEEDHQGVTTDQGQGRCQNDVGHVLDLQ